MAMHSESSSNGSNDIVLIDLTQSPNHEPLPSMNAMEIPHLSPPPFIPSISLVDIHHNDQNWRSLHLAPPPFHYVHKWKNFDSAGILKEAKSMNDNNFEFLWLHYQELFSFSLTAGGRTTCLRTLSNK